MCDCFVTDTMSSSSESGVSDTIDPIAIVSDDEIHPEDEVFTSDTTSSDDDDFQPFALPDFGDDLPLADGFHNRDLPLIRIPAPFPLPAFPLEDLPLDDMSDDDVDLFIEGPPEDNQDGGAPIDDDVAIPLDEIPVVDIILPVVVPVVEPVEAPILPDDQPLDIPVDHELAPADPEPEVAPEPILAHDLPPVHDPISADVPVVAPLLDPIPVFVNHAPFATHVDPRYAHTRNGWIEDDDDYPPFVRPVTPPSVPVQVPVDVPQFYHHVLDVHRMNLPVTFLQDIPPPRPGEGPSGQQHDNIPHMSAAFPFMPPFAPAAHTAFSSAPTGEPFLWSSPNIMPLSDPYHPFHVGYSTDDLLLSLQLQQDMLSRRVAELERIPRPPPGAGPSQSAFPPTPLFPYPDFGIRFLTMEQ
ncbi:hypothetical protein HanIR_Chr16g0845041 [Helianthus annuus]|nr:hypothetical protein HanIR_Chr16g0845041 [Helianthus annuus]